MLEDNQRWKFAREIRDMITWVEMLLGWSGQVEGFRIYHLFDVRLVDSIVWVHDSSMGIDTTDQTTRVLSSPLPMCWHLLTPYLTTRIALPPEDNSAIGVLRLWIDISPFSELLHPVYKSAHHASKDPKVRSPFSCFRNAESSVLLKGNNCDWWRRAKRIVSCVRQVSHIKHCKIRNQNTTHETKC